jgi:hypothetical protein
VSPPNPRDVVSRYQQLYRGIYGERKPINWNDVIAKGKIALAVLIGVTLLWLALVH